MNIKPEMLTKDAMSAYRQLLFQSEMPAGHVDMRLSVILGLIDLGLVEYDFDNRGEPRLSPGGKSVRVKKVIDSMVEGIVPKAIGCMQISRTGRFKKVTLPGTEESIIIEVLELADGHNRNYGVRKALADGTFTWEEAAEVVVPVMALSTDERLITSSTAHNTQIQTASHLMNWSDRCMGDFNVYVLNSLSEETYKSLPKTNLTPLYYYLSFHPEIWPHLYPRPEVSHTLGHVAPDFADVYSLRKGVTKVQSLPAGSIPPISEEVLMKVSHWLNVYAEFSQMFQDMEGGKTQLWKDICRNRMFSLFFVTQSLTGNLMARQLSSYVKHLKKRGYDVTELVNNLGHMRLVKLRNSSQLLLDIMHRDLVYKSHDDRILANLMRRDEATASAEFGEEVSVPV